LIVHRSPLSAFELDPDTIPAMNNVKTVGLLAFMSILVALVADSMGAPLGVALGLAAVMNLIVYFFSDKMAIAASRAKPVSETELPQVYGMIRRLALQADMPMPRIYLIDSPQPNAFATGRNPKHAAVAVTTGILEMLDGPELEGVLGHELSHVKNRDILISSIAAMLAAALSILARMALWGGGSRDDRNNPLGGILAILALIVGPIAAMFLRFAISRTREYQADRSGAELTGQPLQLASALAKIGQAAARIPMKVNPAVSQLFIENPMKAFGARDLLSKMFSTHPPMEDRIARLQEMAYNR
jgi:heat shock protein HtpX